MFRLSDQNADAVLLNLPYDRDVLRRAADPEVIQRTVLGSRGDVSEDALDYGILLEDSKSLPHRTCPADTVMLVYGPLDYLVMQLASSNFDT